MKWMSPQLKLGFVIALGVCAWAAQTAQAARPLLRAVFQRSSNTEGQLSIASNIPNQTYPYAGIKLLDSRI